MFGPGLVCDRFQFIQPLPDFVGHRALGDSHVVVDQRDEGAQLWMSVLDPAVLPDAVSKAEFLSKMASVSRLRHPSLVRTAVVERDEERIYVGYEALPGALVLSDLLDRYGASSDALTLDRARAVARALDALHRRGIVHGALDGSTVVHWEDQCLLWNYGVLPAIPAERAVETLRRAGGDLLMPPECLRGEFTPASDIFAWGVLVARMLTGEGAVTAVDELLSHGKERRIDPEFLELVRTCTQPDPRERPRDATYLVARLEAFEQLTRAQQTEPSPDLVLPPPPMAGDSGQAPIFGSALEEETAETGAGMLSMADLSAVEEDEDPAGSSVPDLTELVEQSVVQEAPRRPSQPTAKLAALAAEIVGDDGVEEMGSVFEGQAPSEKAAVSQIDLEKLALGVEAAATSSEGLALIGGGDADAYDTFATRTSGDATEPSDDDIKIERAPKKVKVPRPKRVRRPGPHGPPPNVMSRGTAILTGALTLLFTLHVANERGGYAALVDPAFSEDVSTRVVQAVSEARDAAGMGAARDAGGDEGKTGTTGAGTGALAGGEGNTGDTGTGDIGAAEAGAGADETTGVRAVREDVPAPPKICPKGTVAVDETVCIDVAEFPGYRRIPRVDVTFAQAARACEERGARLCDKAEWRRACEGGERLRYPYGNRLMEGVCNTASVAGYDQNVALSGSLSGCVTAAGVYDMVGNVGEWVANGHAVGADVTVPQASANCRASGVPPRGYAGATLGFRCCVDR